MTYNIDNTIILLQFFILTFMCFIIGIFMGEAIQENLNNELYFIENNNLINRTCIDHNNLAFCRKFSDNECELYRNMQLKPNEYVYTYKKDMLHTLA